MVTASLDFFKISKPPPGRRDSVCPRRSILFRRDVRPFGRHRAFHQQNQTDKDEWNDGEDEEDIEVSERGRLLGAQVIKHLQRQLFGSCGVAGLLKQSGLNLIEVGTYRRIEGVEIFVESQAVKLLAALVDRLRDRGADAAAFVAQERKQADGSAAQLAAECAGTPRRSAARK